MIDFRKLVLESTTSKSLLDLIKGERNGPNTSSIDKIKYKFPSIQVDRNDAAKFNPIIIIADKAASLTSFASVRPYTDIWPILDFVWFIRERTNTTTNRPIDYTKFATASREYRILLNDPTVVKGADPFDDYVSVSARGKYYARQAEQEGQIGRVAIELLDNETIQQAFFKLLKARKKAFSLPSTSAFNQILINPKQFAGGITKKLPNNITENYEEIHLESLLKIGLAVEEFFESELTRIKGTTTSPTDFKTTIVDFITNKNLEDHSYKPKKKSPVQNLKNVFFFEDKKATPTKYHAVPPVGEGGYILKNIKNIGSEQSKKLMSLLTRLADYIKTGDSKRLLDIASAAVNIVPIKTMGGS